MKEKYIISLIFLLSNSAIASEKLKLDCTLEYKSINTTERYLVVVDFSKNEIVVDGTLYYTVSGVEDTVEHSDGTKSKNLMKVFQINEDFIEWGRAKMDGSKLASDVISRTTGMMKSAYGSGACKKIDTKF